MTNIEIATKISIRILMITVSILAAHQNLNAQFNYTAADGAITVTGYTGLSGNVVIPETLNGLPVTSIGGSAFKNKLNVTSVTFPNTVTSIGREAFQGCTNLTSAPLPLNLISIDDYAFISCSKLSEVSIPASVLRVGSGAFAGCLGLASIDVDGANASYASENDVLFDKNRTKLLQFPLGKLVASYVVPSGVTIVESEAFRGCDSLTYISIPNGVRYIGGSHFARCKSLNTIDVATDNPWLSSLNGVLFDKQRSKIVLYPEGRTGNYAVPSTVTTIGQFCFGYVQGLTEVSIPSSVTKIELFGFYGSSLTSINLGTGLESIGQNAFDSCTNLLSISIPAATTTIDRNAFRFCSSLTDISVASQNPEFSSLDGVLFSKDQTTLIQCPSGKTGDYTIPNTVTSVGDQGFIGCDKLTDVLIPNGVISIGDSAFSSCSNLTNITIPDSVTSVGAAAFYSCTKLEQVTIFDGVATLGNWAFAECSSLTTIRSYGNPPIGGYLLFDNAKEATIYYLPWTTGWEATYGGRPTAVWFPEVHSGGSSFGVSQDGFEFQVEWAVGAVLTVEACTNLAEPNWVEVGTMTFTDGSASFTDSDVTDLGGRFYRLRSGE